MARISQRLLDAIQQRAGIGQAAAYRRISAKGAEEMLPRNLAAIRVGAELGLAIHKYASADELNELRGRHAASAGSNGADIAPVAVRKAPLRLTKDRKKKNDEKAVFVVHGRDDEARDDMFAFLRALGLHPLEWAEAVKLTKKAAPYVGEILDAAFEYATAVVVLMTPDDVVQLRQDLLKRGDGPAERRPTGQARPNVLFEAGLAFGSHPRRTVLVEFGKMRPFSDVGGRHTIRMNGSSAARHALAGRIETAGCKVNRNGTDWLSAGAFVDPDKRAKAKQKKKR